MFHKYLHNIHKVYHVERRRTRAANHHFQKPLAERVLKLSVICISIRFHNSEFQLNNLICLNSLLNIK